MPPVAVPIAAPKEADESIAAPKEHGPRNPVPFSLQTCGFRGTVEKGHDRHRGPWQADAVMVGEGYAPVVAVLLAFAYAPLERLSSQ
jgi:hypothetical protein